MLTAQVKYLSYIIEPMPRKAHLALWRKTVQICGESTTPVFTGLIQKTGAGPSCSIKKAE